MPILAWPVTEAFKEHLQQEQAYYEQHAEERMQLEEEIYDLQERLRQENLDELRDWLGQLKDAELQLLEETQQAEEEAQQRIIERLRERSEAELKSIRERQEAEEEAQQQRIQGIRDELSELQKLWAAEDRRQKLEELQAELAAVKADTRYQKVDPITGELVWTYDVERARELEKQIAEQQEEERRQAQRDELEQRLREAEDRLQVLRDEHQAELESRQEYWDRRIEQAQEALEKLQKEHRREYDERQAAWDELLALDDARLKEMVRQFDEAMGTGKDGWYGVLTRWLDQAVTTTEDRVKRISEALEDAISRAWAFEETMSDVGGSGKRSSFRAFSHGGVADPSHPYLGLVGERVREYMVPEDYLGELAARIAQLVPVLPAVSAIPTVPTLPASMGAAVASNALVNVSMGGVHVTVNGDADPQRTAAAVEDAIKRASEQLRAEVASSVLAAGRTYLRTGQYG